MTAILGLFAIICAVVAWTIHPLNPHSYKLQRRIEFNYYRDKERKFRDVREGKRKASTVQEREVLQMTEPEFEEWAVSLWRESELWYNIREQYYIRWATERQFEILENPSPTETDDMDKVVYMSTKSSVPGRRA